MKTLTKILSPILVVGTLMFPSNTNATEVLTSSARDYVGSVGKRLRDYEMKGINVVVDHWCSHKDLLKEAPHDTEVIVDYNFFGFLNRGAATSYCSGTALIPRK